MPTTSLPADLPFDALWSIFASSPPAIPLSQEFVMLPSAAQNALDTHLTVVSQGLVGPDLGRVPDWPWGYYVGWLSALVFNFENPRDPRPAPYTGSLR